MPHGSSGDKFLGRLTVNCNPRGASERAFVGEIKTFTATAILAAFFDALICACIQSSLSQLKGAA